MSPPALPPPPYIPGFNESNSTCRLVFGKGDCSELEYCSKRGTCVDGQCVCPPGYLDAMCKINMECKYWDEEQQVWSTDGVNTTLSADGTSVECLTSHLTTFGGILDIPTSTEELLAELANAFKFQTFTMDEMFSLLSNFNLGDNPTIIIVVTILILSDIISLLILGFYRVAAPVSAASGPAFPLRTKGWCGARRPQESVDPGASRAARGREDQDEPNG